MGGVVLSLWKQPYKLFQQLSPQMEDFLTFKIDLSITKQLCRHCNFAIYNYEDMKL